MSDRDSTESDSTGKLILKKDIFVMDTDPNTTDDAINLTGHEASPQANDRLPAFSPNGKSIAFTSNRPVVGGDSDVFIVDTDPTTPDDVNPLNLTDNSPQGDIKPDWGPDTTKPEIALRTPAEGDTYPLNQSVTADYECADEGGSGLASCVGDVQDGDSIDTSSVGLKPFTVEAIDNAGNTYSVTHNYSVVYDFSGFFSPVDNPPTLNSAKAGSAIPVKFSLSGDQGLDIFAEGYPKSQEIPCDSTTQVDGVEETVIANKSGLTYEATSNEYTYVWKTEKSWASTCRQLMLKLNDGTSYTASFKFK